MKITWSSDSDNSKFGYWSSKSNFRDWTIIVTSEPSADYSAKGEDDSKSSHPETVTYYVHKLMMARSSSYFRKLFRSEGLAEHESQESRLVLESSAAKAFPEMLAFMYDTTWPLDDKDVEVDAATAVALSHLANYFGIKDLFNRVNAFIEGDMKISNIRVYFEEARRHHDDEIIRATMVVASKNWREFLVSEDGNTSKTPDYLEALPEEFHVELYRMSLLQASKKVPVKKPNNAPNAPNFFLRGAPGVQGAPAVRANQQIVAGFRFHG